MPKAQLPLPYIPHAVDGTTVSQRRADGYINATGMCQAAGKNYSDWSRLGTTRAFINELEDALHIPRTELIQIVTGGYPQGQGTWVHPQVAINLATWCSARFAVQVSQWVYDWSRGIAPTTGQLPFHIRRYMANLNNVPAGHFSVLTEMMLSLIGPLEAAGYRLPERLWPDISQGLMFARYLREELTVDTDALPTYRHIFEDGRQSVNAKAYPNRYLVMFRSHFTEVWMPQRLVGYFKERDSGALKFLPQAFPALGYKPTADDLT